MLRLMQGDVKQFASKIENRPLICFGAGKRLTAFCACYPAYRFQDRIALLLDSNEALHGTHKTIGQVKIPVHSYRAAWEHPGKEAVVLVTNFWQYDEIVKQLDADAAFDGLECYIEPFFEDSYTPQAFPVRRTDTPLIPHAIHYCWFGGSSLPERLVQCVVSWRALCPGYEIIRWDETNYDVTRIPYMKEAYQAEKWAFVSDYARLDVVYRHGGIYLDTDVEVLKPLDDLCHHEMFVGFESNRQVAFGLGFGAVKGHPVLRQLLERYAQEAFLETDCTEMVACPVYQTECLQQHGLKADGTFQ